MVDTKDLKSFGLYRLCGFESHFLYKIGTVPIAVPFFSTSMAQSLKMEQRIGMRLSQQQLRFVKLLELNAPELDEAVERELEDNPALGVKRRPMRRIPDAIPFFCRKQ